MQNDLCLLSRNAKKGVTTVEFFVFTQYTFTFNVFIEICIAVEISIELVSELAKLNFEMPKLILKMLTLNFLGKLLVWIIPQ